MGIIVFKSSKWQDFIRRIAAIAPISRALSHILSPLDQFLLRLSAGRVTATTALTALPVISMQVTGAKTGLQRTVTLAAIPDGEDILLIATNFGKSHHPAWYHNLSANPLVSVTFQRHTTPYLATEVEDGDYQRCWALADAIYTGFSDYRRRAGDRRIPILRLTRVSERADA
jgi:deazaflavin-dependent oxidoreductase (nitroreductase family)